MKLLRTVVSEMSWNETKRLAYLKAEQAKGQDTKSGRRSLAFRIVKHENRIAALNAGITVRNNKPTEEERKEVESREIEKYFKATGTDRTAEGMLSALKEGKFQNDQLKETGKREYAAYLNRQNAGLQYLYGSKTDAAASSAELVNYYFKYFGEDQDKEDLNRFLERMRQNQDEKQQKENLRRYQEVQLTEQTRAEGMEYSHWGNPGETEKNA